jgi:hypothetical protein
MIIKEATGCMENGVRMCEMDLSGSGLAVLNKVE